MTHPSTIAHLLPWTCCPARTKLPIHHKGIYPVRENNKNISSAKPGYGDVLLHMPGAFRNAIDCPGLAAGHEMLSESKKILSRSCAPCSDITQKGSRYESSEARRKNKGGPTSTWSLQFVPGRIRPDHMAHDRNKPPISSVLYGILPSTVPGSTHSSVRTKPVLCARTMPRSRADPHSGEPTFDPLGKGGRFRMVSVSIRMKPKNSKGPVQVNDLVGYNVTEI